MKRRVNGFESEFVCVLQRFSMAAKQFFTGYLSHGLARYNFCVKFFLQIRIIQFTEFHLINIIYENSNLRGLIWENIRSVHAVN